MVPLTPHQTEVGGAILAREGLASDGRLFSPSIQVVVEGADSEGLPFSFLKEVSDCQLKTVIQCVCMINDRFVP